MGFFDKFNPNSNYNIERRDTSANGCRKHMLELLNQSEISNHTIIAYGFFFDPRTNNKTIRIFLDSPSNSIDVWDNHMFCRICTIDALDVCLSRYFPDVLAPIYENKSKSLYKANELDDLSDWEKKLFEDWVTRWKRQHYTYIMFGNIDEPYDWNEIFNEYQKYFHINRSSHRHNAINDNLRDSQNRSYDEDDDEYPDFIHGHDHEDGTESEKTLTATDYIKQTMEMFDYMEKDRKRKADESTAAAVKQAGIEGEERVEYALGWLPNEYAQIKRDCIYFDKHCIRLLNKNFRDEIQEFDHIVVGPNGIFTIETKNYGGKIIIDKTGNWIQQKGNEKPVGMANPVQQVDRHHRVLYSILKDIIPESDIIDIICISNERAIIDGEENCPIPVVKSDLLERYISEYKNGKLIEKDIQTKIINIINEHKVLK